MMTNADMIIVGALLFGPMVAVFLGLVWHWISGEEDEF